MPDDTGEVRLISGKEAIQHLIKGVVLIFEIIIKQPDLRTRLLHNVAHGGAVKALLQKAVLRRGKDILPFVSFHTRFSAHIASTSHN